MTRGTDANLAFVFTTPARPADPHLAPGPPPNSDRYDRIRRERAGYLPAPPPPGTQPDQVGQREPVAVLADVLSRDGAEQSASATRQRNLANADHLATLHAIWTAETKAARNDRYRDLVTAALPPGHRAASVAPGPLAVPHPARRRTGWPGPRRGHPHRHRLPRPGRIPRHRCRPRRPDPPAHRPAAPAAAWPLGRTGPRAARPRTPGLPGPDRRDDGRPHPAPGPAHRPDRPRLGHHRSRPGARRPGRPPRLGAQGRRDRRVPRDVRLRPSRRPDRSRTQPPGTRPAGRLAPSIRRSQPGRWTRCPRHARRPTMATPRRLRR